MCILGPPFGIAGYLTSQEVFCGSQCKTVWLLWPCHFNSGSLGSDGTWPVPLTCLPLPCSNHQTKQATKRDSRSHGIGYFSPIFPGIVIISLGTIHLFQLKTKLTFHASGFYQCSFPCHQKWHSPCLLKVWSPLQDEFFTLLGNLFFMVFFWVSFCFFFF